MLPAAQLIRLETRSYVIEDRHAYQVPVNPVYLTCGESELDIRPDGTRNLPLKSFPPNVERGFKGPSISQTDYHQRTTRWERHPSSSPDNER
jgi:hypothetical protein